MAGDEARWVQRGRACNGRALAMSVSNRWTRRVVAKISALEESNEVGRNERRLASATRRLDRPDRAPFCGRLRATGSLCPNSSAKTSTTAQRRRVYRATNNISTSSFLRRSSVSLPS